MTAQDKPIELVPLGTRRDGPHHPDGWVLDRAPESRRPLPSRGTVRDNLDDVERRGRS